MTVNRPLQARLQFGGGVDTGRTVTDKCFLVDSPQQQLLNCRVVTPFKGQTQVKLFGSYPLPGRVRRERHVPEPRGPPTRRTTTATNAEIAPSLGRNLAACGTQVVCRATAPVPLVAPNTLYKPRRTQLDLRLSKTFPLPASRQLQANLDVYNVFNSSALLNLNETYGPSWQFPGRNSPPLATRPCCGAGWFKSVDGSASRRRSSALSA